MAFEFWLLVLGAYLLGSVPAAYLVARWSQGIDIRQYGSGNVGAGNIWRSASKPLALLVGFFDLGKGVVMVWAAQLLGLDVAQQVAVGVAAIIGHNWPIFLRFSGGRGILTYLGIIFILTPKLAVIALAIALLAAPFRQLSLGVFIALVITPIFSWFLSQPLAVEERLPITLAYLAALLIALLRRLTAPPTSLTASVSTGQLIVNRLLFDRDIRDRDAWIHRQPLEESPAKEGKD